nr:hypothetical protein [Tanacetum cinerariifolium]
MLAPSGGGLILYQAYGRKAYLLEDKQILSVGVFDEVCSTWMAFGGNHMTRAHLEKKRTRLQLYTKNHEELCIQRMDHDGIAGIKRRRRDPSSDGVRDLVTVSGQNKIFVAQNAAFFDNSLIVQEGSGSHRPLKMSESDKGLELIQEVDTQPSENSREEHNAVMPIEEYELRDLNEPPNYKAALSDPEFDKWFNAMNMKMQSIKDNQVWVLVGLLPNGQTVGRNNVTMLQEVKSWLCKCLSMKDLGEAAYILGIKIIRDRSKRLISLSQSAYLEKILKKFRIEISKKGYTLMMEKPDYRKSQVAKTPSEIQRMQRVPYASIVGSIMYAVRCTRPDVAFAQHLCSRFQQNPGENHWTAVKTILNYLRKTKDMVLVYGAKLEAELKVSCYADKSAKQSTNAMSFIEVEYIVAVKTSMKVVWIRKFIDGLGDVVPSNKRPMEMLCDNEPPIAIAADPGILNEPDIFEGNITTFVK